MIETARAIGIPSRGSFPIDVVDRCAAVVHEMYFRGRSTTTWDIESDQFRNQLRHDARTMLSAAFAGRGASNFRVVDALSPLTETVGGLVSAYEKNPTPERRDEVVKVFGIVLDYFIAVKNVQSPSEATNG